MEPDEFYTFRVQYLADMDPFNCLTMFPMPTRAPTYSFASSTPLATQLGAIVRLLGAPQRVYFLFFYIDGHLSILAYTFIYFVQLYLTIVQIFTRE